MPGPEMMEEMMVEGPSEEGPDPVEMHAKTFISAVGRKDPKAVAMAFRAMKQACEEEYGGPDDLGI